jgi:F-type H+-transporting ATPase subunit epsilon
MKSFELDIYTPSRQFYKGQVDSLSLEISDGAIGIYAGRAPFTAPVEIGSIEIIEAGAQGGKRRKAFVSKGLIEVKKFKTVILAEAAEWPEEIDRERAAESKARAEKTLASDSSGFEKSRAEIILKRAEARLKMAAP